MSPAPNANRRSLVDDADDEDGQIDLDAGFDATAEVFDLGGVDENQQYELLDPSTYDAIVENCEYGRSQRSGAPMLTWQFKVINPKDGAERILYYHTVITEKGLPRLKRALVRIKPTYDVTKFKPREVGITFLGDRCRVRVGTQANEEGQLRNTVRDVLPAIEDKTKFLD